MPRRDSITWVPVDSADDLQRIADNLGAAGRAVFEQKDAACCYARGDKGWTSDPSGISWETFHTFGEITEYGHDRAPQTAVAPQLAEPAACCVPSCCGGSKA